MSSQRAQTIKLKKLLNQENLPNDIHSQNCLWDTFMLHFGRMLKTAIYNSTETLRFQDEVLETRRMDSYIMTSVKSD